MNKTNILDKLLHVVTGGAVDVTQPEHGLSLIHFVLIEIQSALSYKAKARLHFQSRNTEVASC